MDRSEFITAGVYGVLILYGFAAMFQRSAVAHLIAGGVMLVALAWHTIMALSLFNEVGGPLLALCVFGGLIWMFTPTEDRGGTDTDLLGAGAGIGGGLMLLVLLPAALFLGLGLAHVYEGVRLRRKRKSETDPVDADEPEPRPLLPTEEE
ncbi:MAG: hypothetical protein AAFR56_14315 [Chloroflexota bacterium]